MTDPLDNDDDWAELARELARDTPPAPEPAEAAHDEAVDAHHGDPRAEDTAEGDSDDEFEDAEEGAAGEAGETTADGEQPGTGRKRRRRRRRRRKGGAPAEGAAAVPAETEEAGEGETELTAEAEEEPVGEAVAEGDDYDAAPDDSDAELAPLSAEEDTASEVLRELIAHWNVPSWDEIVSGLYRPG
jgi:ribonuclease E